MLVDGCVFCQIVARRAPAQIIHEWPDALAIVPLQPVAPGHLLVLPVQHVRDFMADPAVTAAVALRAAEIAHRPCNLIASAGGAATQTVWHLHLHVVPRRSGDGLALPWSGSPEPAPAGGEEPDHG
ncbi:MAG: HIT domain-containing protein [Micromonosporaceae bacterium]|nr:HIT domain-containing protein [Micromonosporaceae bacterium]